MPNYLTALDELCNAVYWVELKGYFQCYASLGGWIRVYEWAQLFLHPDKLIINIEKDLKTNGGQIVEELADAVLEYEQEDMYKTGYDVGEAFAKLFLDATVVGPKPVGSKPKLGSHTYMGKPVKLNADDATTIAAKNLLGLFKSFKVGDFDIATLKQCVQGGMSATLRDEKIEETLNNVVFKKLELPGEEAELLKESFFAFWQLV